MAQQYETQSFDLIKKVDEAEIRFYPPAIKIRSSRKNGFGALFGYISGRNSRDQKIAMTTPVYLGKNEDNEMMEFVLPRSINKSNAPKPLSEKVEVYESRSGYYIAHSFGGYAFDWAVNRVRKNLEEIAFRNKIMSKDTDIVLLGNPTSVKTLNEYIGRKPRAGEVMTEIKKGAPANVKAAIRYNDLLRFWNIKGHSEIVQGDKIKWIY